VHTGFWWENLIEGDNLEYPGMDGRIILKLILKNGIGACTSFIWLRTGTRGTIL
jgi:hypothetical protein